jgi:hypothetical protein
MHIVSFKTGAFLNHPNWFAARNINELVSLSDKALQRDKNEPTYLFPVEKTVQGYTKVFSGLVGL